jgi:hypothetical protein
MNIPYWINQGWRWASHFEANRFEQSLGKVRELQTDILLGTLRRNRSSEYGRKYQFDRIHSIEGYRDRVPVVRYDLLTDSIDRIRAGHPNVLTSEPVERLVPTGGSSGGVKLIPYTASLKRSFQKAIAQWVESTFRCHPEAMHGRAYWSITPMAQLTHQSSGGIPVGFESDSEYLGVWSRWLAEQLILPPKSTSRIRNIENARYANLLYMLACSDLALMSVWSPTFLLSLLSQIDPWIEPICKDIADGKIRLPSREPKEGTIELYLQANRKRAEELARIHRNSKSQVDFLRLCWPKLSLISCWGDGNSASHFAKLQRVFAEVPMQPKGLLATECVVSIPSRRQGKNRLAIRSHFFEFAPTGKNDTIDYDRMLLADELNPGTKYRIVVTTDGGLYRYDLGDLIEVVGYEDQCPQVRFVGRMDAVSDLVGEKLHEDHVRSTIEKLFSELSIDQDWYLLLVRDPPLLGYTLILSADTNLPQHAHSSLADLLDERLRSNPQYDLARKLNQLASIDLKIHPWDGRQLWTRFEAWQSDQGKRVGELKANVLDYRGTWREFLSMMDSK